MIKLVRTLSGSGRAMEKVSSAMRNSRFEVPAEY